MVQTEIGEQTIQQPRIQILPQDKNRNGGVAWREVLVGISSLDAKKQQVFVKATLYSYNIS